MHALGIPPAYAAVEREELSESSEDEEGLLVAPSEGKILNFGDSKLAQEGRAGVAGEEKLVPNNDDKKTSDTNNNKDINSSRKGGMLLVLEDKGGMQNRLEEGEWAPTEEANSDDKLKGEDEEDGIKAVISFGSESDNDEIVAADSDAMEESDEAKDEDLDQGKKVSGPAADFIPLPEENEEEENTDGDGYRNGRKSKKKESSKDDVIFFPGINAPIPEGADPIQWNTHQKEQYHSYRGYEYSYYQKPQHAQQHWQQPYQPASPPTDYPYQPPSAAGQPPAPRPMQAYNAYEGQYNPPPAVAPMTRQYEYDYNAFTAGGGGTAVPTTSAQPGASTSGQTYLRPLLHLLNNHNSSSSSIIKLQDRPHNLLHPPR